MLSSPSHHLLIPRRDKPINQDFFVPIGIKAVVLTALAIVVAISIGSFWAAANEDTTVKSILMGALGILLIPIAYYLFQTALRLWNRFHVSDTGLTVTGPFSLMISVSWEEVIEIRHRPALKRFDLSWRGIDKSILIEEQVGNFCDLLTLIAERTFHLLRDDQPIPSRERTSSRFSRRNKQWLVIGEDSITLGTITHRYEDIANIEFKQGGGQQLPLVLLITTQYGNALVVPLHGKDPVATYQRLRRAHLDYLDRNQLTPPAAPPVMPTRPGSVIWRMIGSVGVSVVIFVVYAFVRNPDLIQRISDGKDSRRSKQVVELFRAGRYDEVVELGGRQLDGRDVDERTLNTAILRGVSLQRLGRNEEAIRDFEAGLPALRALDNVQAERYGELLYNLAELYGEGGEIQRALETVEEGLRIRPQSTTHQLLAAYWYELLGDQNIAQARYGEILPTLAAGSEGHVVTMERLAALAQRNSAQSAHPVQREQVVHISRRIVLVPINQIDDRIDLSDTCLLLESKLELPCSVNSLVEIPEERITVGGRTLYHADRIASLLYHSRRPDSENVFVIGVTSHDIYAGDANFLFSAQYPDWHVAVVSSYRLTEHLPAYWDADVLATRRLLIQLLSAVGTGFGLDRPTSPHCPLAYPNGVEAFMNKSDRLCASTRTQWRNTLTALEGRRVHFDGARLAELAKAQRKYLVEPEK